MADNASKTERRVTPGTLPPQPPAVVSTWPLLTIRTLALVGLCVAGYLAMLHYQAGERGTFASPLCTISSTINCNAVLGSVYARLFGVPIATWAALTYVAILGTSFLGSIGVIVFLCSWSFVFSLYMAGLSLFTLKAGCLFCMSLYAINIGLFISALALIRQTKGLGFQQLRYGLAACVVLALGFGWAQAKLADKISPSSDTASSKGFAETYDKLRQVTLNTTERNIKGPLQAAVTISEFVDFRCPACARAHAVGKQLMEKYPDDVRVIFHSYPLDNECNSSLERQVHAASCLASYAAECAGEQGKFWEFADRLFVDQQREFSRPDLEVHANAVGLDINAFNTCMNSGQTKGVVRKDIEEGIRVGVNATPTLVVNGRVVEGLPTPEQFDTIVAIEKQRTRK